MCDICFIYSQCIEEFFCVKSETSYIDKGYNISRNEEFARYLVNSLENMIWHLHFWIHPTNEFFLNEVIYISFMHNFQEIAFCLPACPPDSFPVCQIITHTNDWQTVCVTFSCCKHFNHSQIEWIEKRKISIFNVVHDKESSSLGHGIQYFLAKAKIGAETVPQKMNAMMVTATMTMATANCWCSKRFCNLFFDFYNRDN